MLRLARQFPSDRPTSAGERSRTLWFRGGRGLGTEQAWPQQLLFEVCEGGRKSRKTVSTWQQRIAAAVYDLAELLYGRRG